MALANVKRARRKSKNRSNKVNLVFDEEKRRDFLTGFRKRKLQRKKHAQEKLELELKEERKRLKAEAKESYKKLVVSHRDIPELQKYLPSTEYEEDDVTVKLVELSASDIAKQNNWIGANEPKYELEEDSDGDAKEDEVDKIPGMELSPKTTKVKKEILREFQTEKQIKKELKKQATRKVQKSKVFQRKNKLEQQKQKKKSFKTKKQNEAVRQKFGKKRTNSKNHRK
ncbi:nucleolar protein 12 [Euwallacea similis]|uniref:nucleolar protein 12 n=1 Tax=Euwallacea similis TaxID=1736056 RepID=UPI00344FF582